MNAPQKTNWKRATSLLHPDKPLNNWICKCGIGNYSHESRCVKCGKDYEAFNGKR